MVYVCYQSYVHPFTHLCVHPPTHSSIHPFIQLPIHPPTHPPTHPSIHSNIRLCPLIHLPTHPLIQTSIHSSILLLTCLPIHPSTHPTMFTFIYLPIYPPFIHSTIYLLIQPSISILHPPILPLTHHPSIYISTIHLFIHSSSHPSAHHQFIHPSMHHSLTHPSIHPCIQPQILHPSSHPHIHSSNHKSINKCICPQVNGIFYPHNQVSGISHIFLDRRTHTTWFQSTHVQSCKMSCGSKSECLPPRTRIRWGQETHGERPLRVWSDFISEFGWFSHGAHSDISWRCIWCF